MLLIPRQLVWLVLIHAFLGSALSANEAERHHRSFQTKNEGIVIAEWDNGSPSFQQAGLAGAGAQPVDVKTLFEIGSITKTFTTLLLASTVNEGLATLNDSIAQHLPAGLLPEASPLVHVTLAELATHTAGLPTFPSNISHSATAEDPYAHYGKDDLYEALRQFREGDGGKRGEFVYSNLGMGLLGHLLELIHGQTYEALLQERILEPLGMADTFVQHPAPPPSQTRLDRLATGHQGGKPVGHWHFDVLCGAGAIVSSASDLLRYGTAYLSEDTPQVLAEAMKLATTPNETGRCLGWVSRDGWIEHGGATGGFRSLLRIHPQEKRVYLQLTNSAGPASRQETSGDFAPIAGYWTGSLSTEGGPLRLLMRMTSLGHVVLHSLNQAKPGVPADLTSFTPEGQLTAAFPSIGATFEAAMKEKDPARLVGRWQQNDRAYDLVLQRTRELPTELIDHLKKGISQDLSALSGYWSGFLQAGPQRLFIILAVDSIEGTGEARLYSPEQTPLPFVVTSVDFNDNKVVVRIDALHAEFEGTLGADDTLTGEWVQGPLPLPLQLRRSTNWPTPE